MKKVLCFAMLVLITAVAFAQSYREYDTPNGKSYFINSKTGKSSAYQFINNENKNMQTELLFSDQSYYKETDIQPQHQPNRGGKDNHHLTIHFDKGMWGAPVYISNSSTTYTDNDMTWSSDRMTGEIDVPGNTYEIVSWYNYLDTLEFVFVSDINITEDMDTTINFEQMANHQLTCELYDENGNLIDPNDPSLVNRGSEILVNITAPYNLSHFGIVFGSALPNIMISDFAEGRSFLVNQFFAKQGKSYTVDYELNSLSSDTTLQNNPSDYKNLKVVTHVSPSSQSNYLTYLWGFRNFEAGQGWLAYRATNKDASNPSFDKDTVQLYLANTEHFFSDGSSLTFGAGVYFWDGIPNNDYNTYTCTQLFYVDSEDSISGALWNKNTSSPVYPDNGIADMNYTSPSFITPSYNNHWASNSITFSGDVTSCVYGQTNEERRMDMYLCPFEIKKYGTTNKWGNSGVLYDLLSGYIIVPEAGKYSLSITDENYILNGLQGCTSLENVFDLTNSDANPPALTSFKIMNSENAICNTFDFNGTATLQFSAYDYNFSTYQRNPPASIEVYYKKHYDTTWTALSTVEHLSWYDAIACGYFYTSDISSALSQFTGSGYLDIKIMLSDEQGNSSTQIWRPAVYVVNNTQYENDIAITTVISPVSGENLGLEDVTVKIKNVGLVNQSNIPVYYRVNDEEMVSETVPGTILPGDSTEYTFSVQVDFSAASTTTYTIEARADLANDENLDNDFQYVEITNYMIPKIVVMPTSIQMSLSSETVKTLPLTITNNGSTSLNYDLGAAGDASALCTDDLYTMGCIYGNGITDLELLGISMDIDCAGEPAWYHNFTDTIFDMIAGQSYTINLMAGSSSIYFDMWIDFNDDFQFTDDEIIINDGNLLLASTSYPFEFTLPANAQFGNHIMRIRSSSFMPVTDPCASYTFGNCCDFTASVGPVWLSPDPSTGTVEPGQSQEVTLTFNTNNLELGTYNKTLFIKSNDLQNPTIEVPVTLNVTNQPWPFNITDQTHTINVPASAEPSIFGEPMEAGDWVGVFYIDNENNEVCGGAAVINEEGSAVVTAYGDDSNTYPYKEGFATDEEFKWRLYDLSEAKEYNANATYDATMPNQGDFANLGQSKLTSLEANTDEIEIINSEETIKIYPNPASDYVNVQVPEGIRNIRMMNSLCVTVYESNTPQNRTVTLNTSNLKAGSYILQLTAADGSIVNRKIIISR